eukprot:TRINITY_DN16931_c0_g1_i1.p2 TRINITY_DN16931_c0_g1~~TRINITY_DN16931_c0_g1_i1.p2  ORF type:complete len:110 (+),score=46.46 TRINITY_DN16931_c0_g1_i1:415-744(+)
MSEEWRSLSDGQKKIYEDMADKDKARYEKERQEYEKKGGAEAAKEGKTSAKRGAEKKDKARAGSVDKKEGKTSAKKEANPCTLRCYLSLIHICRCRRIERCRSRWSPYH